MSVFGVTSGCRMSLLLHPLHIEVLCQLSASFSLPVAALAQRVESHFPWLPSSLLDDVLTALQQAELLECEGCESERHYLLSPNGGWALLRLLQRGELTLARLPSSNDPLMQAWQALLQAALTPAAALPLCDADSGYWLDMLADAEWLWAGIGYLPLKWIAPFARYALLRQIRTQCEPNFWQQAQAVLDTQGLTALYQGWTGCAFLCSAGTLPANHWLHRIARSAPAQRQLPSEQELPVDAVFSRLLAALLLPAERGTAALTQIQQQLRAVENWPAAHYCTRLLAADADSADRLLELQGEEPPRWGDLLLFALRAVQQGAGPDEQRRQRSAFAHIMRYPPRAPLIALTQALLRALAGEPATYSLFNSLFPDGLRRPAAPVSELSEPTLADEMATNSSADERVVWILAPKTKQLTARIQKRGKKGWTKGRQVSIYNLRLEAERLLDEDDLRVYRATNPQEHYFYRDVLVDEPLLQALSRHPRVLLPEGERLILLPLQPLVRLLPAQEGDGVRCLLNPRLAVEAGTLRQVAATVWQFYQLPAPLVPLLRSLQRTPSDLPPSAVASLQTLITRWPQQPWYSEHPQLQGNVQVSEWLPTPYLWLNWSGDTLEIQLTTQPEQEWPHPLPPGQGEAWIMDPQDHLHWLRRDLAAELAQAQVWQQLFATGQHSHGGSGEQPTRWRWQGAEAIAMLHTLQSCPERHSARLLWHKESPRAYRVDTDDLKLRVNDREQWFALDGELQLEELKLASLDQLLRHEPQAYITLDDGQILLLTARLQQQLATLRHLVAADQSFTQQLAFPLQQLLQQQAVPGDPHWQALTERWQQPVAIAPDLLAPLRAYQCEGVRWLAHLSEHGFGACLADDMGLGKTVQALTLLRLRRQQGPALVVVPKSVLHNWACEVQRFAPELVLHDVEQGEDRQQLIANAGAGEVIIISYGLLARCASWLSARDWATVILDEAQQIKNANTQRARSLFRLRAQARIALSGTPVENDLTELWSLFAFINPGLLGSKAQFMRQYASAVRDSDSLQRLRALVSPFILRRTKRQVLTELPEKTEITHSVSLSEQERALYERARNQTLLELAAEPERGAGMTLLSGLTRLRQICCHPQLSFPDYQGNASKLEETLLLVEEALAGQHRVLIFSQFVGLLTLLRHELEARGLGYSYLDGRSSSTARQQAVADFKQGKHPLFLISLKAGGTGLNLTEADTVIHLDPWWNPAVEDQASDRAHRMGQTQPVTVYRLVAEDTIEEKIVALHAEKRELADKVLSGQSQVDKLDSELLYQLLTE